MFGDAQLLAKAPASPSETNWDTDDCSTASGTKVDMSPDSSDGMAKGSFCDFSDADHDSTASSFEHDEVCDNERCEKLADEVARVSITMLGRDRFETDDRVRAYEIVRPEKEDQIFESPLTSVKVHRWDGEHGQWVVDCIDIPEQARSAHEECVSIATPEGSHDAELVSHRFTVDLRAVLPQIDNDSDAPCPVNSKKGNTKWDGTNGDGLNICARTPLRAPLRTPLRTPLRAPLRTPLRTSADIFIPMGATF